MKALKKKVAKLRYICNCVMSAAFHWISVNVLSRLLFYRVGILAQNRESCAGAPRHPPWGVDLPLKSTLHLQPQPHQYVHRTKSPSSSSGAHLPWRGGRRASRAPAAATSRTRATRHSQAPTDRGHGGHLAAIAAIGGFPHTTHRRV
jgi:hypothetical protein